MCCIAKVMLAIGIVVTPNGMQNRKQNEWFQRIRSFGNDTIFHKKINFSFILSLHFIQIVLKSNIAISIFMSLRVFV